jgi:hypothetical protein
VAAYIYETPDEGLTVYRREVGNYVKELIQKNGVPFRIDPETETELKGIMKNYAKNLND